MPKTEHQPRLIDWLLLIAVLVVSEILFRARSPRKGHWTVCADHLGPKAAPRPTAGSSRIRWRPPVRLILG